MEAFPRVQGQISARQAPLLAQEEGQEERLAAQHLRFLQQRAHLGASELEDGWRY